MFFFLQVSHNVHRWTFSEHKKVYQKHPRQLEENQKAPLKEKCYHFAELKFLFFEVLTVNSYSFIN